MDAPEDFGTVYDPIETLTYVAARTSRITLGTSVLDALTGQLRGDLHHIASTRDGA